MSDAVQWFQEGGWPMYALLALGALGMLAGLAAIGAARSGTAGLVVAGGSVVLGLITAGLGLAGWLYARATVDDAITGLTGMDIEMLRAVGYEEASHVLICGVVGSLVPIVSGAIGLVLAARKLRAAPQSRG